MRQLRTILGLTATIAPVAVLLLMPLPGYWHGIWQSKLLDLGHVPLFASLTLLFFLVLGRKLRWPIVLALTIAGLAEIIQEEVGRTGEVIDFLWGALGVFSAAAGVRAWQSRGRRLIGTGYLLAIVALVAWPLAEAIPYLLDAYSGYRAFPILSDFRSGLELRRWICSQAELTRANSADGWHGRLTFLPGPRPYPHAALRPIIRDFRDSHFLCCDFTVEEEPIDLIISLRSGSGAVGETTHYQEQSRFLPGAHVWQVDLASIAPKAQPSPLDLSDVWMVQLFLEQPRNAHRIALRRLWLE